MRRRRRRRKEEGGRSERSRKQGLNFF